MVIATRQKHQLSPLQLKLTLEKTDIELVHEHRAMGVTTVSYTHLTLPTSDLV